MSCIFCMIKEGKIPSKRIYENDHVLAFLDLSQAGYGHTLVIPKVHSNNLLEMSDNTYLELMKAVKLIANHIKEVLHPDGLNIINNCGEAAGQTIMHAHVHIIPRFINDNIKFHFPNNEEKYNLDEIQNKLEIK